jgi:hypothetical protein
LADGFHGAGILAVHVADQVESMEIIEYAHIERRGDRAFFLAAAGN